MLDANNPVILAPVKVFVKNVKKTNIFFMEIAENFSPVIHSLTPINSYNLTYMNNSDK